MKLKPCPKCGEEVQERSNSGCNQFVIFCTCGISLTNCGWGKKHTSK